MSAVRIVIFAKAPVAGKAKTRLIPALGAAGAAHLAERMLADTVAEVLASGIEAELCASPAPGSEEWQPFLPALPIPVTDQGDGDLGARLARAAERVLEQGQRVLLMGSDCPQLRRHRLRAAADALAAHDAVLHPALDGGYALLGLSRFDPSIFTGIPWSTASVASDTVARIQRLGWPLHIGDTLRDVDEPEDLDHLQELARDDRAPADECRP